MENIIEAVNQTVKENIIVVAYLLPPDIKAMLDNGDATRIGNIIKGPDKKFFKHLEEINISKIEPTDTITEENLASAANNAAEKVSNAVTENPNKGMSMAVKWSIIGIGTVALAGGIYFLVRVFMSKKKKKELNEKCQKTVDEFNLAMNEYLNAVEKGTLNKQIIESLSSKIGIIKDIEDNKNVKVEISIDSLLKLLNFIYEYSLDLAKANSIKTDKFLSVFKNENDSLVKVRHCLQFQKAIFDTEKAA